MSYLEELLPEFRKGAKIRKKTWDKGTYIYLNEDTGYPQGAGIVYTFSFKDLVTDYWELYQDPIDWDYIIKNKCLCWFFDDNENIETKRIATFLYKKPRPSNKCFIDIAGYNWKQCRPVRRDEVTFYEDRKDE